MKFSIRELLLVTVIVALALAWWIDRRQRPQEFLEALKWKTSAGAMEEAFRDLGWQVEWEPKSVRLIKGNQTFLLDRHAFNPSPIKLPPDSP